MTGSPGVKVVKVTASAIPDDGGPVGIVKVDEAGKESAVDHFGAKLSIGGEAHAKSGFVVVGHGLEVDGEEGIVVGMAGNGISDGSGGGDAKRFRHDADLGLEPATDEDEPGDESIARGLFSAMETLPETPKANAVLDPGPRAERFVWLPIPGRRWGNVLSVGDDATLSGDIVFVDV